jgi:serine/threonine protein phosphatase PrpC
MLDDATLLQLLSTGEPLDVLARSLVAEANERGGLDNITVLLLRAEAE